MLPIPGSAGEAAGPWPAHAGLLHGLRGLQHAAPIRCPPCRTVLAVQARHAPLDPATPHALLTRHTLASPPNILFAVTLLNASLSRPTALQFNGERSCTCEIGPEDNSPLVLRVADKAGATTPGQAGCFVRSSTFTRCGEFLACSVAG